MSNVIAIATLVSPIGMIISGPLAELITIEILFISSASLNIVFLVIVWIYLAGELISVLCHIVGGSDCKLAGDALFVLPPVGLIRFAIWFIGAQFRHSLKIDIIQQPRVEIPYRSGLARLA